MIIQNLQLQQLDRKMKNLGEAKASKPPVGWVKALRSALGISLQQLGNKLSVTKQSVHDMEKREQDGTITLKALRETADALDMELVYGFVPKDGSLEALVDRKARELATQIVMRTAATMRLEGQENSEERLRKAIEERAAIIKRESPKIIWG